MLTLLGSEQTTSLLVVMIDRKVYNFFFLDEKLCVIMNANNQSPAGIFATDDLKERERSRSFAFYGKSIDERNEGGNHEYSLFASYKNKRNR